MAAHRKNVKTDKRWFRTTTIGLAVIASVTLGGVATQAGFTDTSTSTVIVQGGSIDLSVDNTKSAVLDLGKTWKPGDTTSKTVTVKNSGTLPLTYKIASAPNPGTLANVLDASVKTGTANAVTTKLSAISTANRTLAAGASETVTIAVTWTAGTQDNQYQGADGTTVLNFTATQ